MVSLDGKPYTELNNAWLYREKFIDGCSCDAKEYSEADIAQSISEIEGPGVPVEGHSAESAPAESDSPGSGAAAGEQAGGDDLIIRDTPEAADDDSFDPRRR